MVNFIKLVEKVSESLEKLAVNSALCARTHSKLSKCSKCIEVCSVQAINITNNNIEINHCIDCGLCAKECPTGALKWKFPSNLSVIEKVKQFEQDKEPVYIHCSFHKVKGKNINHIEVPCLASILPEIWSVMLNSKAEFTIYLSNEACQACSVFTGSDLLSKDLKEAEQLTHRKMSYISGLDECKEKAFDSGINEERRDSISYLFKKIKKAPLIAFHDWVSNGSNKEKDQSNRSIISPRKEVIHYIYKNHAELQPILKIKLPVINEKCEFCQACSLLCPNQALSYIEDNNKKTIRVDPILCSECNLCQEICFFEAIKLKEAILDFSENKYINLASKSLI